jgi:carboxyl-terminal processing protease
MMIRRWPGIVIFALMLGAFAFPVRSAEVGDDRGFAAVKEAFGQIRANYVDEIDDAKVIDAAIKAMLKVPGIDPRSIAGNDGPDTAGNTEQILGRLESSFKKIQADDAGAIETQKLVDFAIFGMITALDPHTQYIDPPKWRDNLAALQLGGVGLNLTIDAGEVGVVSAIENGPAQKAGIVAGDRIVAIDRAPVAGLPLPQVVARLRGPLDSRILLTVSRGKKPIEFAVTRATVHPQNVFVRRYDDFGYIVLTGFGELTQPNLKIAIEKLQSGAGKDKLRGYILDLRNNAGGFLDAVVSIAGGFLGNGLVATTRSRDHETQRFEANSRDLTGGKPIVVLINGGTAAGAEIVASALQEHHRATIVGARSAGAGTIQTVIALGEGNGALRLTTSRIYTSAGQPLDQHGVSPDFAVEQPAPSLNTRPADPAAPESIVQDRQFQFALNVLKKK